MTDIERDAARYRWIKAAPRLRIERMPDSHFWISTETGQKYNVTHCLSAFDTGFHGLPTLDELVDQAMEMYPIPGEVKPKSPVEQAYKDWWGEYPGTENWTSDATRWQGFQAGYNAAYEEKITEEPEGLKTLYDVLCELDKPMFTDDVCSAVKKWMSQYTHNAMSGEYASGYEDCMLVLEEHLK